MNQTGVIFFGLLVGFVVFITVRGELAAYLGVLGLSGSGSSTSILTGAKQPTGTPAIVVSL